MATNTPNYNLIKPDDLDSLEVEDLNNNSDIIDFTLKGLFDAYQAADFTDTGWITLTNYGSGWSGDLEIRARNGTVHLRGQCTRGSGSGTDIVECPQSPIKDITLRFENLSSVTNGCLVSFSPTNDTFLLVAGTYTNGNILTADGNCWVDEGNN